MAANVGTASAQFFQGANPVSAYLGATPIARTMYFNGAVDQDWAELGNWWLDSGHTVAAIALPTAGDSVIATASITSNSGSEPTVVNFTLNEVEGGPSLGISVTVTGVATFGNNTVFTAGTLTGNATFNGASAHYGDITGNATFNDSSGNDGGTVTGNATFNDSSQNFSTITGNATFNDSSRNEGTVTGTATFTGGACNDGGTAGTFVPDPPPSCI